MTSRSEDKAIANLLKWMNRPEWKPLQMEVYLDHLTLIAEDFDIPEDEVPESLGPSWNLLEIFILEHFFSSWFEKEEGEVNIIQDYLKRRRWKESVLGRRYLEALRDSLPSLYEVLEVNPGRSMKLKDLVGGGGTIVVQEKSATKQLVTWDCLAARVVSMNRHHYLTGGVLPFTREMSKEFLKYVDYAVREERREIRELFGEEDGESKELLTLSRKAILGLLPMPQMLSSFWAIEALEESMPFALPEFRNADDEPILLCEVRFPILGDMMKAAAILDEIPALKRTPEAGETEESDGEIEWAWVSPGDPSYRSLQRGRGAALPEEITENTEDEIGLTGLGHVVLDTKTLILTAYSKERGERGRTLLESCLGDLVGRAVTSYSDFLRSMEDLDEIGFPEELGMPIPEENLEESIRVYYDRHYHRILDEPLPALGQMTPREAAKKSGKGRREVIDWLKGLENVEQRSARREGHEAYNMSWMWQELGIRKPR